MTKKQEQIVTEIENELDIFRDQFSKCIEDKNIILTKDIVIDIPIYFQGERRCMARVWQNEKHKDPDINHRCNSKCCGEKVDLCRKHLKLEEENKDSWCGRVNERPHPRLITIYAKRLFRMRKDKNLDISVFEKRISDALKLDGHSDFKIKKHMLAPFRIEKSEKPKTFKVKRKIKKNNVELKDKKINKYKSNNMELEQDNKIANNSKYETLETECEFYGINYSDVIDKIKKLAIETSVLNSNELNNGKIKHIFKELGESSPTIYLLKCAESVFYDYRSSKNCLPVSGSKQIIEKSIEQSNIDIYDMESIRLIDDYHNAYDLYYSNTDSGTSNIYNQNSKSIGNIRKWIDDEGEVPEDFKTADNIVLDPLNKLPVFEVEISIKGSGFESVKPGIYREFEYDEDSEVFRTTGAIIRS